MFAEEIGNSVSFSLNSIASSRFVNDSKFINIVSPFSGLYLVSEDDLDLRFF